MFKAIKKSVLITIDNPILTMSFVIYLIFLTLALPKLFVAQNLLIFALISILTTALSAAFLSGWLQMIKSAIKNSKKENRSEEEKLEEFNQIKKDFFCAVPVYTLPLLVAIILYLIMFALLTGLSANIANHYIGSLDFLIKDANVISQGGEALQKFILNLPKEKIMILYGWQLLFDFVIGSFNFLLMFWLSALYYPQKCSLNPISALKNSILAIIKHPIRSAGLYLTILFLGFLFRALGMLLSSNVILYFIFMILFIYFVVFIFVLIFDYYESRFYNHNTDGCDFIGQNKTCN